MPAVCATHELITQVTTPASLQEQSQSGGKFRRIWDTLVHLMTGSLTHTPRARQLSHLPQPFESPMDRLARENPSLSLQAISII